MANELESIFEQPVTSVRQGALPEPRHNELQELLNATTTTVPDTTRILEQGRREPLPPPEPVKRQPGMPPRTFLSQEGSLNYPRPYGTTAAGGESGEVAPPAMQFAPTTLFPEGPSDTTLGGYGRQLGGAANRAIDIGKGLVGGLTDPETLEQIPMIGRYVRAKRTLEAERRARAAREGVPTMISRERAGLPGEGLTPARRLTAPPSPPPSAPHARLPMPSGEGGGPRLPAIRPSDIVEPPDRLGPDGTWTYEPWRPSYDVFLNDWRDPNISWWEKLKRRLPADYGIATKVPESPVIGILDRPATDLMNWTDDFVHSPELKELSKLDAGLFVQEEAKAYAMWDQSRRMRVPPERHIAPGPGQVGMQIEGLTPEASFEDIMRAIDPRVRPYFELFRERMKIDQESRAILGLGRLDEVPYPYLPRMAQEDWDRIMTIYRGDRAGDAVSQLTTTIKGFQQARSYSTMSEGLGQGMLYEDPRRAIIMRLMLSKQLEFTAKMMQELKGTVLFPTREAALAEMYRRRGMTTPTVAAPTPGAPAPLKPTPIGEPIAIRGVPGPSDAIYFVPSTQEALALNQHLRGRGTHGVFGEWSAVFNQFFRNPNLLNPAPHVVKNMGYKYVIAAAGLGRNPLAAMKDLFGYTLRMPFDIAGKEPPLIIGRLAKDATEYAHNLNPTLIAEFNRAMPFSRTAATAYENLKPYLERSKPMATLQTIGKYLTGNAWSSKYIFSKADPAMKYSLWKMYREKGMSADAAANQVNIDLVRYTLRSDLTDTWKNVPLNFFVPWRTGTVMATAKQLSQQPWATLAKQAGTRIPAWAMTRPIKTSMLIGAWMIGRDAYHRQTGFTLHLPIDYVDGPITQLVTSLKNIPNVLASLYILGPGGDLKRTAHQLGVVFGAFDPDEMTKVMEMYWGIAQLYGGGEQFVRFAESLDKHGVKGADYSLLAHVLMSAAFAEYETYSPKEKHLTQKLISEGLLPYDEAVKANIELNRKRQEAGKAVAPFKELRQKALKQWEHERVHGRP